MGNKSKYTREDILHFRERFIPTEFCPAYNVLRSSGGPERDQLYVGLAPETISKLTWFLETEQYAEFLRTWCLCLNISVCCVERLTKLIFNTPLEEVPTYMGKCEGCDFSPQQPFYAYIPTHRSDLLDNCEKVATWRMEIGK